MSDSGDEPSAVTTPANRLGGMKQEMARVRGRSMQLAYRSPGLASRTWPGVSVTSCRPKRYRSAPWVTSLSENPPVCSATCIRSAVNAKTRVSSG